MYAVNSSDSNLIERIWQYTQYLSSDFAMYKTRLAKSSIVWVIESPKDSRESLFLLQWSDHVYKISNTYYS